MKKWLHMHNNDGWEYASRKEKPWSEGNRKADAVHIIAIHEKTEQCVLVKQFRKTINDYIYEVPAGMIDEGESIDSAARRELFEETGLIATDIQLYGTYFPSIGMSDECVAVVLASASGKPTNKYNEGHEDIEVVLASLSEIKRIIKKENVSMALLSLLVGANAIQALYGDIE